MEPDASLKKLQHTELEILKVVARFCEKHDLQYSLYAGTLLGAVRHQGFIPWDDDIDICMPREDYRRFIELWNSNPIEGYILQNHDNTPGFTQTFTKIRKDHTTFYNGEMVTPGYHFGIFIDIFPVDRIPDGTIARYRYWFHCIEYQLLLHGYIPKSRGNTFIRAVGKVLLTIYAGERRNKKAQRLLEQLTAWDHDAQKKLVLNESAISMKKIYPADLFEHMCYLPFEDTEFKCFQNWDAKLRGDFGDYMTLPPEEDQVRPHEPEILSYEYNYEEVMAHRKKENHEK